MSATGRKCFRNGRSVPLCYHSEAAYRKCPRTRTARPVQQHTSGNEQCPQDRLTPVNRQRGAGIPVTQEPPEGRNGIDGQGCEKMREFHAVQDVLTGSTPEEKAFAADAMT